MRNCSEHSKPGSRRGRHGRWCCTIRRAPTIRGFSSAATPAGRANPVPRQFVKIANPNRKPFGGGSGRLDLAREIVSKDNPLTARVFVNRVWMHHFGEVLVGTPGDFGLRGDAPTHPELLDWLAAEFVAGGWKIKRLHKLIMTSATYTQASLDRTDALAIDSDNRLLWKQNRQRLGVRAAARRGSRGERATRREARRPERAALRRQQAPRGVRLR